MHDTLSLKSDYKPAACSAKAFEMAPFSGGADLPNGWKKKPAELHCKGGWAKIMVRQGTVGMLTTLYHNLGSSGLLVRPSKHVRGLSV